MDRVAFTVVPSEKPAAALSSLVPCILPDEIEATAKTSGTVLTPGSLLPKKKFPDSEVLLYVAAGCTSKIPRVAEASALMEKAEIPSDGFVR